MVRTYSSLLPRRNHCFGQAPIHPCSSSEAKIIFHTIIIISQTIIIITINTSKNQINLLRSDWWWIFFTRDPNLKLATFLHPIPQNLQSACSRILLDTKSTHPQNLDRRLVSEAAQENPQNLGRPRTWNLLGTRAQCVQLRRRPKRTRLAVTLRGKRVFGVCSSVGGRKRKKKKTSSKPEGREY